jgi:hypothetical protein
MVINVQVAWRVNRFEWHFISQRTTRVRSEITLYYQSTESGRSVSFLRYFIVLILRLVGLLQIL